MVIAAALIGILLIILGQHYYIARNFNGSKWQDNLTVSMEFGDEEIIEGDESFIKIQITNRKLMPLPALMFKFQVGRGVLFIDNENAAVSDKVYIRHIFTMMSYQRVTRKSRIRGIRRGYYHISDMDIVANDLMYINSELVTIPCDIGMYVLPARSHYVNQLIIPFKELNGQALMNSMYCEDPFEFRGIRQYQTYDTMKKINWNASAKTGELKVNQYFDTVKRSVIILLNLEKARCSGYEILQEESIRIVRTLMEWFGANGVSVSFYTNAKDIITGKEVHIDSGGGSGHISNALRTLARIDIYKEMRAFGCIVKERGEDKNSSYLMISANCMDYVCEAYNGLKEKRTGVKWLVPGFKDSPKMEQKYSGDIHFVEVERI